MSGNASRTRNLICQVLGHRWLQLGRNRVICQRCGNAVENARIDE